jgi:hypothetical protein
MDFLAEDSPVCKVLPRESRRAGTLEYQLLLRLVVWVTLVVRWLSIFALHFGASDFGKIVDEIYLGA